METLKFIFDFIKEYGMQLGVIGVTISFIVGVRKFTLERKDAHYWKEFEVYHKLIKELVEPDKDTGVLYIDRQAAIVFELRNFKRYYPISLRTLKGLLKKFESSDSQHERLKNEVKLTIDFLERKTSVLKIFKYF